MDSNATPESLIDLALGTAGTNITVSATDSAFHTIFAVFNGASSTMYSDNSAGSTANAGSNTIGGAYFRIGKHPCIGSPFAFTGNFSEYIVWHLSPNSTQRTNLYNNVHSYF